MVCVKCGGGRVIVESTGNGGSRRTCQDCGESQVVNREGKKLLTDDMPAQRDQRRVLES